MKDISGCMKQALLSPTSYASKHIPTNRHVNFCALLFLLQGMTLLMMGSAEALPEEPAVRPMFVEDMTEEQLASAVSKPENDQYN